MYQEVCFNRGTEARGGVNAGHSLSPPSHFMLATGLLVFPTKWPLKPEPTNSALGLPVFILEKRISQGCALEEPDGPWRPTFALDRLENLTFFIQILYWAPWILQVPSTGLPSSFLKAPRVRHIIPTSSHELCIQSWVMDLFAFNVCLSLCPVVVVWLSVACTGVHYV